MTPVPMPIEGQPSNINHHMYIFLNHNVSATTRKYFGTLPEENQSTGYLAAADQRWSVSGAPQLRAAWTIPSNTNSTLANSTIPFVTVGDSECNNVSTNCSAPIYTTYKQVDNYQNATSFALMNEDVAAEHNQTTASIPVMDQFVKELLKAFKIKMPVKE